MPTELDADYRKDLIVARKEVIMALKGGHAHATFEDVVANFPLNLQGESAGLPYSAWQLLEHIRIAQHDIVRFTNNQNGTYETLTFPDDYWPKTPAPPNAHAWEKSVAWVVSDRETMIRAVGNPRHSLAEPFAWGDGQNLLREAMLIVDHTSYHVGELLTLRRLLGIWPAHK